MAETTVAFPVLANSDDGYVYGNPASAMTTYSFNNSSSLLVWGRDSSLYHSFIRFANITIPSGVVIKSAKIRLSRSYAPGSTGTIAINIHSSDTDNPTAPANRSEFIAVPLSTIYSTFQYTGDIPAVFDVDVTNVVADRISRSGWTSGNAILFTTRDTGSTKQYHYISPYPSPSLEVTYEEAIIIPPALSIQPKGNALHLTWIG